jgi:CHAD domain-containing protein
VARERPGLFIYKRFRKNSLLLTNLPDLPYPGFMKTTAKLRTYYLHQVGVIEAILRKSGNDFSTEDFHALRLGIKKIKSVLTFLNFFAPDFSKQKYYTPYKKLFSLAGAVREIQIQQTQLKEYTSNPLLAKYFDGLSSELEHHHEAFAELIDKKLRKKIKSNTKKVDTYFQKAAKKLMSQYLLEEQHRIQILLKADKLAKKDVHDLRKQIKDIYYLQKIFQPKDNRLVVADEFQELLGQWHDNQVLAKDILKGAKNHNLQPDEVKALMALRKNILARADRLLTKIETARKTM